MAYFTVQCTDGKLFDVSEKYLRMSTKLTSMLDQMVASKGDTKKTEDDESAEEKESEPLSLKVDAQILHLIIEWAVQHENDCEGEGETPDKLTSLPPPVTLTSWDDTFFGKLDRDTLFALIEASNALDYKALMNAACKVVAEMIPGKTEEELRELFNLDDEETLAVTE